MTTRCYFNRKLMCTRSINREAKELLVNFVGSPPVHDSYPVVEIDDYNEPNHISQSYDAANQSKLFVKWRRERFEEVTLISKTEVPAGICARFNYKKLHG